MLKRIVFLIPMVTLVLGFCLCIVPAAVDITFVTEAIATTETSEEKSFTWEEAVYRAHPAVVLILDLSGRAGTGIIFDEEGYVLTCNHIVEDVYTVAVELPDGRVLEGIVVGRDASNDLAVLKIGAKNLPVLPFGDSDQIKLGQEVMALGYPYSIPLPYLEQDQTVTRGIVSAFREMDGIEFIQTDAATNPGNSGGPLINIRSEVIAIHHGSLAGAESMNFSIAVNQAKPLISKVKAGEIALFPTLSQAYMYTQMHNFGNVEIVHACEFPSDTQEIWCHAEVLDAPSGTEVNARWLAVDLGGMEEDAVIAEESWSCEGNESLDFYISPADGGEEFPTGQYQVMLYLDGEEQIILYFKVIESSAWGDNPVLDQASLSENIDKGSSEKSRPKYITNTFVSDTPVIYSHTYLYDISDGTELGVKWSAVRVGESQNTLLYEWAWPLLSDNLDFWVPLSLARLNETCFIDESPIGRYSVTWYLDYEELVTLYFKVIAE